MRRVLPLALAVCLLAPASAAAQLPAGLSSEGVEHVRNIPRHFDTAGGRLLDGFFYVTTERDLAIYDTRTDPENPTLVGETMLDTPGQPVFTEEDPDTNGRILLVSNTDLQVYDVSDKANPTLLSTLPGFDQHTISCVLDCTWAYGSAGGVVDLRDPRNPKLVETGWNEKVPEPPSSTHDVTEVSPGLVMTSSEPMYLLDVRQDPTNPTVVATAKTPGFAHANLWPQKGTDAFLLVGGEATGPGCAESASASFMTFDARSARESKVFGLIDEFKLATGTIADGRQLDSTYCVHWFEPHPTYANGGLVAISWYEHGTRFLKVDRAGQIEEVGYWLPFAGQASDVDWITPTVAYVTDYLRGLDVIRFTAPVPPSFPTATPPGPTMPAAPPTTGTTGTGPTTTTASRGASFSDLVTLPSNRRCTTPKRLRIRLRTTGADPVVKATLRIDGRRRATVGRAASVKRGLRLKTLPKRRFTATVQVTTKSGRTTAGQRRYRPCR